MATAKHAFEVPRQDEVLVLSQSRQRPALDEETVIQSTAWESAVEGATIMWTYLKGAPTEADLDEIIEEVKVNFNPFSYVDLYGGAS
jgi:hypothetical protein